MAGAIEPKHFESFCRRHSGQSFTTLYRPSVFTIEVPPSADFRIHFPKLGEKGWTAKPRVIERYLSEYARNGGSLRPKDYTGITGNFSVSRMVALFNRYLDHLPCPGC